MTAHPRSKVHGPHVHTGPHTPHSHTCSRCLFYASHRCDATLPRVRESRVVPGGMVPSTLRAGMTSASESVTISSGRAATIELPVAIGTRVSWSFKVPSKDVNFHAYFLRSSAPSTAAASTTDKHGRVHGGKARLGTDDADLAAGTRLHSLICCITDTTRHTSTQMYTHCSFVRYGVVCTRVRECVRHVRYGVMLRRWDPLRNVVPLCCCGMCSNGDTSRGSRVWGRSYPQRRSCSRRAEACGARPWRVRRRRSRSRRPCVGQQRVVDAVPHRHSQRRGSRRHWYVIAPHAPMCVG